MLTFGAPALLWGLSGVALPLAVHLFNFRRYRKVYFSNVDRLSALQQETQRHSRLRQRLLLAARIAVIVFIVLAFARPSFGKSERSLDGAAVSIYVDNSFSMQSLASDTDLMTEAVLKAEQIAGAYSIDTRFQLVTSEFNTAQARWLSRDELLDEVAQLQPSPAAPRLSQVVGMQRTFLKQSGAKAQHAYIISDFQKSVSDFDAILPDSTVDMTLVPLGAAAADNIFVDTVLLDAPAYFTGSRAVAEVTLHNDGLTDMEKVPLRLLVSGRERAVATVDIPAASSAKAEMRFTLDDTGWFDITVCVEDYPVTFDNNYYLSFHVGDPIHAVELHAGHRNEYLRRLFDGDTAVALLSTTELPQTDGCHFLVLSGMSSLASGVASRIVEWVRDGGTLLVAPPSPDGNPDLVSLNSLLASLETTMYGQWAQRKMRATTAELDNSLFRNVFDGTSRDMELPSTEGHYLQLAAHSSSQSIIRLADGDDLLTVSPAGRGRVYMFYTPLDERYTDFMSQALFVPTVYNMALYSRPLPPPAHSIGNDSPIALHGNYNPDLPPPHMTDGDGYDCIPDLRRQGSRQILVVHDDIPHAGFYSLGSEHLAFNYSRLESRLECYSRSDLEEAVEERQGVSLVDGSADMAEALRRRDGGHQLWRLCIVLALVALAAETAIALSRPRQRSARNPK